MGATVRPRLNYAIYFSEYGLIHSRAIVEITWLIQLAERAELADIPFFI